MSTELVFAIKQGIDLLEVKLDILLNGIRKDLLGHGQRQKIQDIRDQIKVLKEFLNTNGK